LHVIRLGVKHRRKAQQKLRRRQILQVLD
jgi:hypothetical protein